LADFKFEILLLDNKIPKKKKKKSTHCPFKKGAHAIAHLKCQA